MPGLQPLSAAASGDTAVSPATALTCSLSRGTRLTLAATGWVAKLLSVCKPVRSGADRPLTTGRLPIGFHLITVTPIWVVSVQLWSMYLAPRLHSLSSLWAKMAMPTYSIAITLVAFPELRTRRVSAGSTEEHPLSLITLAREHILVFITMPVRLPPAELPRQVRPRS